MKLSPQATKAHLVVGALLVVFSLGAFIATFFIHQGIVTFLIFFFGVWGGVEIGRYLEFRIGQKLD